MLKVASYDVFDTLLTRVVGDPKAVFEWMARDRNEDGFPARRVAAERRLHATLGANRPTLADIYQEMGLPNFDDEIATERRLIRPVPGMVERVRAAREAGSAVVFLSDMYLPSQVLREWLAEHGFYAEGDLVLVSCEHGGGKRDGHLFDVAARLTGVRPAEIVHVGNDHRADVEGARKIGCVGVAFPEGNLNRYERIWAAHGLIGNTVAGASRLTRLANRQLDPALRDVAASVIAPTLAAYAQWLLRRAVELGLPRLYFVSRDGYLLVKVAQELARSMGLPVECRYLYGSREAWYRAGLHTLDRDAVERWLPAPGRLTGCDILTRTCLSADPFADLFPWDEVLTEAGRERLRELFTTPPLADAVRGKAAEARDLLLAYLAQEGVFDGPAGIVDLGWFGTSREAFLTAVGQRAAGLQWFYFGLMRSAAAEAYFYDREAGVGPAKAHHLNAMLETFTPADHGRVTGYQTDGGRVTPVFAPRSPAASVRLEAIEAAAIEFVRNWRQPENAPDADLRPGLRAVLETFHRDPERADVRGWQEFLYEDTAYSPDRKPFVVPFGWRHVAAAWRRGELPTREPTIWAGGSWVVTPRPVKAVVKAGWAVRRAVVAVVKRNRG